MDRGSRDLFTEEHTPPPSSSSSSHCASMSDALLFTTMRMIGLPVDVHLRDGSVYSGIFHTTSADPDYGVVLKKARKVKKGKCNSNVGNEALVDTLLIPSDVLVQVVSKGITLPSDGVGGTYDVANDDVPMMDAKRVNQSSIDSQAADEMSKGIADDCRQKSEFANERSDEKIQNSNSRHESELDFTMGLIGLPVDIHLRDGSVYSGIFHTTSAEPDYGVVLKKARKIKEGKANSNVGKEALVDTLLIPANVLVQVVSKGITLPSDGAGGKYEVANDVVSMMDAKRVNQSSIDSQAADKMSKGIADDCKQKSEFANERSDEKIQNSNSRHEIDTCLGEVEAVERGNADTTSSPRDNGLLCNNAPASVEANNWCSARSSTPDSVSTNSTLGESHDFPEKTVEISTPLGTDSVRNAKEFKLNPGAKLFSPSFVYPISVTTALPTAPNMVYIPNSSPMVPAATIQSERGFNSFASRPSAPVKVAQYNNFTVGNGGSGSQFSQPIVGQLAHRTQPLRYAAHYDPILSEPAYLQPSSHAVMAGRSAQLVYVQPISHDWIHGATAMSPVSARPLLNHVQYPKQQGGTVGQAMPVCMPPPVLTSGQQPFALHSHIPHLQPGFPLTRPPISVPGPNGFYGSKFS